VASHFIENNFLHAKFVIVYHMFLKIAKQSFCKLHKSYFDVIICKELFNNSDIFILVIEM